MFIRTPNISKNILFLAPLLVSSMASVSNAESIHLLMNFNGDIQYRASSAGNYQQVLVGQKLSSSGTLKVGVDGEATVVCANGKSIIVSSRSTDYLISDICVNPPQLDSWPNSGGVNPVGNVLEDIIERIESLSGGNLNEYPEKYVPGGTH